MAASHEGAQREADLSGVSLISVNLDYVKGLAQFHHADELDVEATYYGHRAVQEEQARGPGYYVGLLQALATDRAAMAQRLRTGNEATS